MLDALGALGFERLVVVGQIGAARAESVLTRAARLAAGRTRRQAV